MTVSQSSQPGFEETQELEMIRQTARDIASDYDDDYWLEVSEGREPTEFWNDCADAGFLGAAIPTEYGGEGMGFWELSAIVEELCANGCLGAEMLFVVNVCFGGITLTENGSEEQKEEWLPGICDGSVNFAMALTEPDAGHNAPNMTTFAEEDGDEYVVDGTKQWISGVDVADQMLLVARTSPKDDSAKMQGVTLFLVDPDDPAIEARELDVGIPTPEKQFELSFDGYRAHEEDIIGTKGMGLYQLFDTVNPERLLGASGAIGVGKCAINRSVDYANEREVFDQPIGAHQGIQHPIADSWAKLQSAGLLVRKAAWMVDNESNPKKTAEVSNMAKLRATEVGHDATDVAVQTHGGNGFSRDYTVIEMWKGSRLGKVAPGSTEMMRNHVAEHTLGLPRSY
ncbi:acyl-CoA/acyl-ACP dehydrogenase [Natronomonas gomsonensis]|jgi:acyl-CoA dehydrogenase|uniref:acyl-CoA dehydrogenase family protein n=1 Tax=Natronomonas gomsonensis TaxID=1046043 RepID=UPI0020CA3838|nr:acyl-CoA dehydrogenase family protein [Natronomonas gomsonensis]MCY4732697.1 acyl-CoA/acyl-ACP dehydrogenase [Natronomonas gomsonensis]